MSPLDLSKKFKDNSLNFFILIHVFTLGPSPSQSHKDDVDCVNVNIIQVEIKLENNN